MSRYDSGVLYDSGARWDEPDAAPQKPMGQNLISQTMTDAQRDALLADLTAFDTKLTNYKIALTPDDIGRLSKLSATDIALLDMALAFAQQNPSAIPGNINTAELAKDIALAKQLSQVNIKAQQAAENTRVSMIAIMSDGFVAGRAIYRAAQVLGRTPEAIPFLDAFGTRFGKNPPPEPPTPPGP